MENQVNIMFVTCMNKCTPPNYKLTLDMPHHTVYDCFRVCGIKFKKVLELTEGCQYLEQLSHDISN